MLPEKNDLVFDDVLTYPRLKERLEQRPHDRKKVVAALQAMRADFSPVAIRPFVKLIDWGLRLLYDGIKFEAEQKLNFVTLVKNNSVVLVPNHQSHADYVAINYKVYKTFKFPLYVAGGDNLNIFPIGALFRKCGCFFIRRSFNSDIVYRLTLEAYLYHLLLRNKPIEFFFEGGRSRTGKLLPPKFGIYQLLLEAHDAIPVELKKPLLFVPVSIVHEYLPEQSSLANELKGKAKSKESSGQLFKVFKVFARKMGTVHIRLGTPVEPNRDLALKERTHDIAFRCFRSVGSNMMVTPAALLGLVLLDEPTGALKWDQILTKAKLILEYCHRFNIPLTDSLAFEHYEESLEHAIDLMIDNKKLSVFGDQKYAQVFYSIRDEYRIEVLYLKNTILHHFLIPWIINLAWINLFNGTIQTYDDLKKFILTHRGHLKQEFYFSDSKEFMRLVKEHISYTLGRKIDSLEECLHIHFKDMYHIISKLGLFSRCLNYIYESYLLVALALKSLHGNHKDGFTYEQFIVEIRSIYQFETKFGKVIRYYESRSMPIIKNALKLYCDEGIIENSGGQYHVIDQEKLDQRITSYRHDLSDLLVFNLRV